jgi:pyridoxamine 5'-phosphate oxidase
MSIADLRREYNLAGLRRRDLDGDPIVQFRHWFDQATGARASGRLRGFLIKLYKTIFMIRGVEQLDLNSMTLATADRQGRPSARVVLLKGLDERGFIFYTNYHSRKGHELEENPEAALVFYWPEQERQVCVAGQVSKLPASESEAYFRSRPRGSRIGAWASDQSAVMQDRAELEAKWKQFEERFPGEDIPCPPHWGGFVLAPARLEFWQGRLNRLHDRFRYTRLPDGNWLIERLSP